VADTVRHEVESAPRHLPVLRTESLAFLAPGRGGVFVDCTLGLGGHAEGLLEGGATRVVGIDRDPQALEVARRRLAAWGDRLLAVEGDFANLAGILGRLGIVRVAGLLADLGLSSLQLDRAARGFSFQKEGPLDMRMGSEGMSAEEILNQYSQERLEKIFREYGEEHQARRVARAVVASRTESPLRTTSQLRSVIHRAKRRDARDGREGHIDPATRVFQALRIEVNQELQQLSRLMDAAIGHLESDGRLVLISYHSLEDRIVKNALREAAHGEVDRVTGRTRAETRLIEVLTKKPVRPSAEEVAANPRARSARLRAARRI
jgi:16S rRNA (cytosine1402-N4)-methyltransferase